MDQSVKSGTHPADTAAKSAQAQAKADGRRERGLRRREAILQAARELFVRDGYRRTTLEAIIARSGGSRETVYSLFGDKHGLVGAIIADTGATFVAQVLEPTRMKLPPRAFLTELGHRLFGIWSSEEGRAINRLVLSEGLNSPEILGAWYRGGAEPFTQVLSRYFSEQVQAGHMRIDDPAIAARQFHLLLMGEAAFPTITGQPETLDIQASVDRTVEIMMRAYGQPA